MHSHTIFGTVGDIEVDLFTLKNSFGMEVVLTNYGGTVTSVKLPLADGTVQELVLGFDNLSDYLSSTHFIGAIIGRYANRIAEGRFSLGGKTYVLAQNNGPNHLHGGLQGFDKLLWDAIPVYTDGRTGIQLSRLSCDGEEGYPGNLKVQVTVWLTEACELIFNYLAETDTTTIVSLTHHGYFNLSNSTSIHNHVLQLAANTYTPVGPNLIPTGKLEPVAGTIFDLREPRELGALLAESGGYDHNFVISTEAALPCAILFAPDSGVRMAMYTSEPGVQLYTGNFLHRDADGVSRKFVKHAGLCLEAQHFPNSPNCGVFPSVVLKPGEKYQQATRYVFSTQ